ncbi:sulfotransferase [Microbaculum marinum]|uniref:Sulfotransferase n=1 Tax=Microbaculum marinum TaxID=1764581 RepID=A0AAW9RVS2_9HYPH
MTRRSPGPDFICIGQQKAGTAFLHALLQRHAEIWMPPVKELHFFSRHTKPLFTRDDGAGDGEPPNMREIESAITGKLEKNRLDARDKEFLRRAIVLANDKTFANYCSCFEMKGEQISGDVTPAYSVLNRKAIGEIRSLLPDVSIILLIRHPVDRFWSSFNQALRRYDGDSDVLADDSGSLDNVRAFLERPGTVRRSYPSRIYKRWASVFPEDRIRVLPFEVLTGDTASASVTLADFLGVTPRYAGGVDDIDNIKQDDRKIPMSSEAEQFLQAHFSDEVATCKKLFGDLCAHWSE